MSETTEAAPLNTTAIIGGGFSSQEVAKQIMGQLYREQVLHRIKDKESGKALLQAIEREVKKQEGSGTATIDTKTILDKLPAQATPDQPDTSPPPFAPQRFIIFNDTQHFDEKNPASIWDGGAAYNVTDTHPEARLNSPNKGMYEGFANYLARQNFHLTLAEKLEIPSNGVDSTSKDTQGAVLKKFEEIAPTAIQDFLDSYLTSIGMDTRKIENVEAFEDNKERQAHLLYSYLREKLETKLASGFATRVEFGEFLQQKAGTYFQQFTETTRTITDENGEHKEVVLKESALTRLEASNNRVAAVKKASDGTFNLTLEGSDETVTVNNVILAVGNLPPRPIPDGLEDVPGYIHDLYARDEENPENSKTAAKIQQMIDVLEAAPDGKGEIIIQGSKSTAMEALHLINTTKELRALVTKITVISPSGTLQPVPQGEKADKALWEEWKAQQGTQKLPTADAALSALKQFSKWLEDEKKINTADSRKLITQVGKGLVDDLAEEDASKALPLSSKQKNFYKRINELITLTERAAAQAVASVKALENDGLLEIVPAKVTNTAMQGDKLTVTIDQDGQEETRIAAVVLNAMGGSKFSDIPLLKQMEGDGLLEFNEAGGVRVDETVHTVRDGKRTGIGVAGPALLGNSYHHVGTFKFESTPGIIGAAKRLARAFVEKLLGRPPLLDFGNDDKTPKHAAAFGR